MRSHRIACLLLLASGVMFPIALAGQSLQSAATALGIPQTDPQKRGEALFTKNCPLCHIFTNQKRVLKIQASTDLIGLFKKPTQTESGVRQAILQGVPRLMPGFQYALEPSELDDLVAYLKIR